MKGNLTISQKLSALWRIIVKNPRVILFAVYLVSAVVALFSCPDGIALGVSVSEGVVSTDHYIPTVPYLLVGGAFMAACTFGGRSRGFYSWLSWLCLIVLLVCHFLFMKASM